MKNLICLMILLTSISSFAAQPQCVRECEGDQRSPVSFNQIQTSAQGLLQSAQSIPNQQQALARLVSNSGKSNIGELSTEEYYAHVALSGRVATIYDLTTCSCPREYPGLLTLFSGSQQIIESIKKQLSAK